MGAQTLGSIAAALVKAGLDVNTPVACVMDGGLPIQKVVSSTLATVVRAGPPRELHPPAVIVIEAVAAFAAFAAFVVGVSWTAAG